MKKLDGVTMKKRIRVMRDSNLLNESFPHPILLQSNPTNHQNTLLDLHLPSPLHPKLLNELANPNSRGIIKSLSNFYATVITSQLQHVFYQQLRHQQKYKVSHLAKHHHLYTINKHRG
jgi:hypothetical protein